jgi:hypothetical protein
VLALPSRWRCVAACASPLVALLMARSAPCAAHCMACSLRCRGCHAYSVAVCLLGACSAFSVAVRCRLRIAACRAVLMARPVPFAAEAFCFAACRLVACSAFPAAVRCCSHGPVACCVWARGAVQTRGRGRGQPARPPWRGPRGGLPRRAAAVRSLARRGHRSGAASQRARLTVGRGDGAGTV